jgi:hypothetical protein
MSPSALPLMFPGWKVNPLICATAGSTLQAMPHPPLFVMWMSASPRFFCKRLVSIRLMPLPRLAVMVAPFPSTIAGYFQPRNPLRDEGVMRLGAGVDGSQPFQGLIDNVIRFRRVLSSPDLAAVVRATWLDAH